MPSYDARRESDGQIVTVVYPMTDAPRIGDTFNDPVHGRCTRIAHAPKGIQDNTIVPFQSFQLPPGPDGKRVTVSTMKQVREIEAKTAGTVSEMKWCK